MPALAATTLTVPGEFPTIQAALNAASPGDTVSVSPGTYSENINFNSQDVTVASTGGASQTTIAAPGGTAVTIGPAGSITGFTISGGTAAFGAGMAVSGAGTIIANDVLQSNSEGTGGFGAAIGGNGASPLIEQDLFAGNTCDDQFLSGVVAFINDSSPTIENNVFHDNTCRAVNLSLPQGPSPLVINNTIVRNSTGIRIDGRTISTAEVVRNNIVADNGTGLEVDFGNGPAWDHNLVNGNTQNYSGIADPAIGAGSAVDAPAVDFSGNPRPQGTVDIGAFQFVSAADQLAALAQAVSGVGPGHSLARKVAQAQSALAAGNTAKACRKLGAFTREVQAQSGKKIAPSTAQQLLADAESIQTALAC
jgi:hypothetical protein